MPELLYNGFHKIEKVDAMINGKYATRERLLLKSAVAGIVIDENNKIGLVIQNRPTIKQTTKEIPAGVLDKDGLTPKQILLEELDEECQIDKSDILYFSEKPVHEYYMIAGSSDAQISLYEICVKAQSNKVVNDHDVERVEWVSLNEFHELVQNGEIIDAKTLIAYYYLKSKKYRAT